MRSLEETSIRITGSRSRQWKTEQNPLEGEEARDPRVLLDPGAGRGGVGRGHGACRRGSAHLCKVLPRGFNYLFSSSSNKIIHLLITLKSPFSSN